MTTAKELFLTQRVSDLEKELAYWKRGKSYLYKPTGDIESLSLPRAMSIRLPLLDELLITEDDELSITVTYRDREGVGFYATHNKCGLDRVTVLDILMSKLIEQVVANELARVRRGK